MKKKLKILALIVLLIFLGYKLYLYIDLFIITYGEPSIKMVPNSTYPREKDKNTNYLYEHYIIDNPPNNIFQIKKLIEDFSDKTPVSVSKDYLEKNNIVEICRIFYRESRTTSIDWDPSTHRLEHPEWHANDLIAWIYWEVGKENEKYYRISEKKHDKYGTIKRRIIVNPDGSIEEDKYL